MLYPHSEVKSAVESSMMEKGDPKNNQKDKEKELLESRSQPMRKYLMDKVIPSVAEGILKICKDLPEEPIEFLADFLVKKSAEKVAEEKIKAEQKAQQDAANKAKYKTPDKKKSTQNVEKPENIKLNPAEAFILKKAQ